MSEPLLQKKGANFFGFETVDGSGKRSSEPLVWRGNGDLELREEGLHFHRWAPAKDFFIPREAIEGVRLGYWHNRKCGWPGVVVKVSFAEDGRTRVLGVTPGRRAAAGRWKQAIEALVGKGT